MTENLQQIVEMDKIYSPEELEAMRKKGEVTLSELFAMNSVRNERYLINFMTGQGGVKLPYDSSVPDELYFTNVEQMLNVFYKLYQKYPQYHFDKVFEFGMKKLAEKPSTTYEFLTILNVQLKNEKAGLAPFSIQKVELLKKTRAILNNPVFYKVLAESKIYRGINKPEGQIDIYREYNQDFISELGFDIFAQDQGTTMKM